MEARHAIRLLCLGAVYCVCGWSWHNPHLKGKEDLDLEAEAQARFEKHRKDERAKRKKARRRLRTLQRKEA